MGEKNTVVEISYFASTLLESKEFWQQVERKEELEKGDGTSFPTFVSSRLSSITIRPGISGATSLSLSLSLFVPFIIQSVPFSVHPSSLPPPLFLSRRNKLPNVSRAASLFPLLLKAEEDK